MKSPNGVRRIATTVCYEPEPRHEKARIVKLLQKKTVPEDGREVLLAWLERSTHPADANPARRGWITHMVKAHSGETVVGYLRVSYTTRESSYAAAPDGLHFMSENRGWRLNFEDKKALWLRAHLHAAVTPRSLRSLPNPPAPWQLSRSDAPELAVIEQDLLELHELGERKRLEQLQYCGAPVVAYARVEDGERSGTDWRRRGIARGMYRLAAQELGTRGLVLMASSLQSEEAKSLWAHFESDPQMPTRRITAPGSRRSHETRLTLDYRK